MAREPDKILLLGDGRSANHCIIEQQHNLMKTTQLILHLAALWCVAFTADLCAQSTAFTYQGRLTENGQPADSTNDLTFTLYNAASGGSVVGTSNVVDDLAISNGLFTVTLNFGAATFDGSDLWLEIAVRPGASAGAYTNLSPRQPITSEPYAIKAANAMTVDMGTISNPAFLGTTTRTPLEFFVNNLRGLRLEDNGDGSDSGVVPDGAPNVIGGSPANFVGAGVVGATIAGGGATNFGGLNVEANEVLADYGTVGGGLNNRINSGSTRATIAGGWFNEVGANAGFSAIGGGQDNSIGANALNANIAGGADNIIAAGSSSATVSGGSGNAIGSSSFNSVIGGGRNNIIQANALYATIPGGRDNAATNNAFAAGNRAKANHSGAFVWVDSQNADFPSTANNQFNVRAAGGVRIETGGAGMTLDGAEVFAGANVSLLRQSIECAEITDGTIVNADISGVAGIADTKLATITTAGKVANSATTANSGNVANAIVARTAAGNFAAGAIKTGKVGLGRGRR